MSLSRLNSVV